MVFASVPGSPGRFPQPSNHKEMPHSNNIMILTGFAEYSCISNHTLAFKSVDVIKTHSSILTRSARTFINIYKSIYRENSKCLIWIDLSVIEYNTFFLTITLSVSTFWLFNNVTQLYSLKCLKATNLANSDKENHIRNKVKHFSITKCTIVSLKTD